MASTTGTQPPSESEPLLGGPGDALQKPEESVFHNLYRGTGWLAQGGIILFVALVWSAVFTHPANLMPLFSPHPLLQSAGILFVTEAILVLQPTWTEGEKRQGQRWHATLNLTSFILFTAGVAIIETNKFKSGPDSHFHSVHGYLGVATSVVLLVQYIVGSLMWGVPGVFGGIDDAKALWKYHRASGYLLYLLLLATSISAIFTPYNNNVLKIKLWAVILSAVLVVAGVYPRLHLRKLGFNRDS